MSTDGKLRDAVGGALGATDWAMLHDLAIRASAQFVAELRGDLEEDGELAQAADRFTVACNEVARVAKLTEARDVCLRQVQTKLQLREELTAMLEQPLRHTVDEVIEAYGFMRRYLTSMAAGTHLAKQFEMAVRLEMAAEALGDGITGFKALAEQPELLAEVIGRYQKMRGAVVDGPKPPPKPESN